MAGPIPTAAGGAGATPKERFLRSAQICRTRDLHQLLTLSDLIKDVGELIHALQKERGASAGFLVSSGAQLADQRQLRAQESRQSQQTVRERLDHIDEQLDRMSSGARFYARVAMVFDALDMIDSARAPIASISLAPQDAVKLFTDVINALLAMIFDASDIAADPAISKAMVALVNFIQGKEFAGQERATASAGFSRGRFETAELRRLLHLVAAQEQAFRNFSQFVEPEKAAAFLAFLKNDDSQKLEKMRGVAFTGGQIGDLEGITGEAWFEQATRRIDSMKSVEDQLTADLKHLCQTRLSEISANTNVIHDIGAIAPVVMLVNDADPALTETGQDGGVGLYTLSGAQPQLMRSIMDVVKDQSRRLTDVNNELQSARTALAEHKVIDRAKAVLMSTRQLSEQDAYALMRKTAMNQHKRIFDVAEAIIGMADILKSTAE